MAVRRQRMLVLITFRSWPRAQLRPSETRFGKRRGMLAELVRRSTAWPSVALPDEGQATLDDLADAEEALPVSPPSSLWRTRYADWMSWIALSDDIISETKIERLLAMIGTEFAADELSQLFTEYKATQAP